MKVRVIVSIRIAEWIVVYNYQLTKSLHNRTPGGARYTHSPPKTPQPTPGKHTSRPKSHKGADSSNIYPGGWRGVLSLCQRAPCPGASVCSIINIYLSSIRVYLRSGHAYISKWSYNTENGNEGRGGRGQCFPTSPRSWYHGKPTGLQSIGSILSHIETVLWHSGDGITKWLPGAVTRITFIVSAVYIWKWFCLEQVVGDYFEKVYHIQFQFYVRRKNY